MTRAALTVALMLSAAVLMCRAALAGSPEAIEVLSGGSYADLDGTQPGYETVPLHVAFYYDAEPFFEDRLGLTAGSGWQFSVEPFVDTVTSPGTSVEAGVALGFKLPMELGGRWSAYVKGGTGPMYTWQDTEEESTKFQFGSHIGLGLSYALDDCSAISVEVRERHMSNASIKRPNSGVNSAYVLVGYSWHTH